MPCKPGSHVRFPASTEILSVDPSGLPSYNKHTIQSPSRPVTIYRPLAGYGLPPPRGNFVDHIFHEAQCLAKFLQHVSPLTMEALSYNSLLHTLPYKIFDNYNSF